MTDFAKLKDEAEKEAQQHPQQVKEGEQDTAKDLDHKLQGHDQQDQDNAKNRDQGQDSASSDKP
jgi:hypothetical protein